MGLQRVGRDSTQSMSTSGKCYEPNCIPPKCVSQSLNPKVMAFGDVTSGRLSGLDEVMRVRPLWLDPHPYKKRCPCEDWKQTYRQDRKKASQEPDHAGTLISDFWFLELWENKFLLLKPPTLWYFVMTALSDKDSRDFTLPHLISQQVYLFCMSKLGFNCLTTTKYTAFILTMSPTSWLLSNPVSKQFLWMSV